MQDSSKFSPACTLPAELRGLADFGDPDFGNLGHPSSKPVLARVATDLFVSKAGHTPHELAQFQEMALALIGDVDANAIVLISEKLARHANTPQPVLERLLKAGDRAAACVLRYAMQISRDILLDMAKWGDSALVRAVAQRPDLDPELLQLLAERPEINVLQALAENPAVRIPAHIARSLVRRAMVNPGMAHALVERRDLDADVTALYGHASKQRRTDLLLAAHRHELGRPVDVQPGAGDTATLLALEHQALQSDMANFEAALASALACSDDLAHQVANDPGGEVLALALAALAMPPEQAARIFMKLDAAIAHSVERVHALTALVAGTPPQVARRIIAAIAGRTHWPTARVAQLRASHQPLPSRAQADPVTTMAPAEDKQILAQRM